MIPGAYAPGPPATDSRRSTHREEVLTEEVRKNQHAPPKASSFTWACRGSAATAGRSHKGTGPAAAWEPARQAQRASEAQTAEGLSPEPPKALRTALQPAAQLAGHPGSPGVTPRGGH